MSASTPASGPGAPPDCEFPKRDCSLSQTVLILSEHFAADRDHAGLAPSTGRRLALARKPQGRTVEEATDERSPPYPPTKLSFVIRPPGPTAQPAAGDENATAQ